MKSKGIFLLVVLSCVAAILVGCGGGGGGGGGGTPSPFMGRWDGSFSQTTPANNGTTTLAIAGNGTVSGDVFDSNLNQEGTLSGNISDTGDISFVVDFPAEDQTWTGTASINGSGHLVGTVDVASPNPTATRTFDLAPF